MKVKTSVTLSAEIIAKIDELSAGEKNRSAFIESAVTAYVEMLNKSHRDSQDLEILNSQAPRLNKEMRDVLMFQTEL